MKKIQYNSNLRIKPYKFVSGGYVLYYTVNPSFGTIIEEVDEEGYMTLTWEQLKQMGRGVLQYKVNNPEYAEDYTATTQYYIDTTAQVDDNITVDDVMKELRKAAIERLDKAVDDSIAQCKREFDKLKNTIQQHQLNADNIITSQLNDLPNKLPRINSSGYVEEYNNNTHTYTTTTTTTNLKGEKGDKGDDGYLLLQQHGTTDTTFALTPNTMHVWGEVETLTLTLSPNTNADMLAEYCFQFTSPTNQPTTLSISDVKWLNNEVPIVRAGKTYQASILNGIIIMV